MKDSVIRYQYNPMHTDTVGFFDYCIPLTNEGLIPTKGSIEKYIDFSVFNYVTPHPAPKKFLHTTSIFQPTNLSPLHPGPIPIAKQSNDWITLIFVICLLIFAWIQTIFSKRLVQIYRAVAQPYFVNQLEREGNLFKDRIRLGLGFIYYSISSFFIFLLFKEFISFSSGMNNITLFGIIFFGLVAFQILKSFAVYTSGIIFSTVEFARQHQLNILIFNYIHGLLLFPIVLAAFYWHSSLMLYAGILLSCILIVYRLFRSILIGMANNRYNLFYLFLYLCTLEILPMLLLYAAISKI